MALTERRRAFVREYSIDFDGQKAAERAGYAPKNARMTAYKILQDPEVQEALREIAQKQEAAAEITREEVVAELALIGRARFTGIARVDEDGVHFKDSDEWDEMAEASVKSAKSLRTVERDKDTGEETVKVTREVVQHDKVRALELLGKHFGIFTDKLQINDGGDGFTIKLKGLPEKPRGSAGETNGNGG